MSDTPITEAELLEMFDGEIPPVAYTVLKDPKVIDKRKKLESLAKTWAKRAKPETSERKWITIPRYRMDD